MGQLEMGHPLWLVRSAYLAFYGWFHIRSGKQNEGNCQLLIKSWPFWASCYRICCLASWIVTIDSSLAYSKSDIPGWLSGLFIVNKEMASWASGCSLWVKVLFYYVVWPLCTCTLSLSVTIIENCFEILDQCNKIVNE